MNVGEDDGAAPEQETGALEGTLLHTKIGTCKEKDAILFVSIVFCFCKLRGGHGSPRFQEGATFGSMAEAHAAVKDYAAKAGFTTRKNENRKRGNMTVRCSRGGTPALKKEVPGAKKRERASQRCGCTARWYFKLDVGSDDEFLQSCTLEGCTLEHGALCEPSPSQLRHGQRVAGTSLSPAVVDAMASFIMMQSTTPQVRRWIQAYDLDLEALLGQQKAMCDITQRLKVVLANGGMSSTSFLELLKLTKETEKGFDYRVCVAPGTKELRGVVWMSARQRW
jgi:hypothetical protein